MFGLILNRFQKEETKILKKQIISILFSKLNRLFQSWQFFSLYKLMNELLSANFPNIFGFHLN